VRTVAILPVKRFAEAKSRLGASLADGLRLELARAMVADVLAALAEADSVERTIVVSSERSLPAAADADGVDIVGDDAERGQSAAVELGVRRALGEGFERVLCVPGDCPALDPGEIDALLDPARDDGCEVVIIPDRHGTGTNGLLLRPPDAIAASFGPGSCERHQRLALAAGLGHRLERPSSLLLDIDTREDLSALRGRLSGWGGRAPRTRGLLADWDARLGSVTNAA
jgi:2-phospho-L-lactate guanylyltransferase